MNEDFNSLYEFVSKELNIGTFEAFSAKMQTPDDRKRFFDVVAPQVNIGGYEEFEARLSKKVDPKVLVSEDVMTGASNIFDDAEDVMVENLRASNTMKSLGIKIEGPDDDQKLDREGRHDDVRLTNEWGKVLIINKSDKDYLKKLNAFTKKSNDAKHHYNNGNDKPFEDWGMLTPTSGVLNKEESEREYERRSGISQKEYFASKTERSTFDKTFVATQNAISDIMGWGGNVFSKFFDATILNYGSEAERTARLVELGVAVSDIHIDKRKRREGERIKKEAEYKAWQNKYSADIPSNMKGMLTKEDYVENRRINGIKNRPSGIDKDIWEKYKIKK